MRKLKNLKKIIKKKIELKNKKKVSIYRRRFSKEINYMDYGIYELNIFR